jgi:hypothetical protein
MIKPSELGKEYTVTYNMRKYTVTISNDPANFKFYKTIGLDVFEEVKVEYKPNRRGKNKTQVKEEE